jgi:hypothetical protein
MHAIFEVYEVERANGAHVKLGLQDQTNRDAILIYRSSVSTWLKKCGQLGCPGRSKLSCSYLLKNPS